MDTKEIARYAFDTFVDAFGVKHALTACAISEPDVEFARWVGIGIAVQNPKDTPDIEIGKKIAFSKAQKNNKGIFAECAGMVTDALMDLLMVQELKYIKENPDLIIKGYSDMLKRDEARKKTLEKYYKLSPTEKMIVDAGRTGTDLVKCANIAQDLMNKHLLEN